MKRLIILCMLLCTSVWAMSQDCSANAGQNLEVCYTESDFQLLGEPATGNVNSTPNYTWNYDMTLFVLTPTLDPHQPLVTPLGGAPDFTALQGTYHDFIYCVDCNMGTSCDTIEVHIGTDPSPATITPPVLPACRDITLVGSGYDVNNESVQFTWFPPPPLGKVTGDQTGLPPNEINLSLTQNNCATYDVFYTINNGGCLDHDTTQINFVSSATAVSASVRGETGAFDITCWERLYLNGSFPGCSNQGVTASWTGMGINGTTGTITYSNQNAENSWAQVSSPGTYEFCYTVANNAPCVGGTVCDTIIVTPDSCDSGGIPCCELGPYQTYYYCGDIPENISVASAFDCAGFGYTFTWPPGNISVPSGMTAPTIPNVNSHSNSFTYPLSTPNRADFLQFWLRADDTTGCTEWVRFRFIALPDIDVTSDTVGISCMGNPCFDLRDFVDYGSGSAVGLQQDAIVVDAPMGSSLYPNIGNAVNEACVDITVNGTYVFDIVVLIENDVDSLQCGDTARIVVVFDDIGNINAGQPILTCDTCTVLNGNVPLIPGVQINWTLLNGIGGTTFNPAAANTPNIQVCGLDNTMPGLVYDFVYSWDAGPSCMFFDTVSITMDSCAPCDTISVNLETCCGAFPGGGAQGGSNVQRRSSALPSGTSQQMIQNFQSTYGLALDSIPVDSCDPCVRGWAPIWAVNENGSPYWAPPFGSYNLTWCWDDPVNGPQTVTGQSIIPAYPNITYTVKICDENGECCSTDTIRFDCCELDSIAIEDCFTPNCDPCDDPTQNFYIWVTDGNGNILPTSDYTFLWNTGNMTNSQLAMVNTLYTVTVTDSAGCEFVDSFYVECCEECIEINTCYGPNGNPNINGGKKSAARSFSTAETKALSREIRKHIRRGLLPKGSTLSNVCYFDPCESEADIFAWLEDCDGNIIQPSNVTWVGSDGTTQTGFTAILQTDVTYTVTWTAADGCVYTDTYLYECGDCKLPPTNLRCEKGLLVWDPVPGATGYMVYATPYTFESKCCPIIRNGQSTWAQVRGTSINPADLNQRGCFLWRVVAICPDGTFGTSTPWFCCNEKGGDGGIKFKDQLSSKEAQEAADNLVATGITAYLSGDLKVTPNPSKGQISLEGYSVLKGSVVRIFDVLGQLVHSSNIQSDGEQKINLSTLLGGNYLLVIETPNVEVPARSWITIE